MGKIHKDLKGMLDSLKLRSRTNRKGRLVTDPMHYDAIFSLEREARSCKEFVCGYTSSPLHYDISNRNQKSVHIKVKNEKK